MKAVVHVTLKEGVLDPQGQAVSRTLTRLGFAEVGQVRVGKFVEITMADSDPEKAKQRVKEMCDQLIANTVIENYTIDIGS